MFSRFAHKKEQSKDHLQWVLVSTDLVQVVMAPMALVEPVEFYTKEKF